MSENIDRELLAALLQKNMPSNNDSNDEVIELDIEGFLNVLKSKILVIILSGVLVAAALGVYSFFVAKPMYESTAKMYITSKSTSVTSLADIQLNSALAKDYQEMMTSYPVVIQVKNNLGLDYSYKKIVDNMIRIDNPTDTRCLNITIRSKDPEEARDIANEFSAVAKRTIADVMDTDEPRIYEKARVNPDPVSPHKIRNIELGFIAGVLLAILIIFIRFVTRDVIRVPEDIQRRLNGTVLVAIPYEKSQY